MKHIKRTSKIRVTRAECCREEAICKLVRRVVPAEILADKGKCQEEA